ncbi:MAG: ThiF family adenylyltransferase, partial [Poseidonia sp.]
MNEEQSPRNLLLVGAGGIGTQLAELLVAALRRVNLQGTITLMDADIVEASNLGHQRYTTEDIGHAKVSALAARLDDADSNLRVKAVEENLRSADQFDGHDLVVVCVDRPEPRRLVHGLDVPWLDVRCSGDGWMVLSSASDPALLERM